ncbi:MAG: polyphosphate kinase 1 [Myxococcales bacterium]|nr:polyphosphate kinase 1 [Myxococcales bacterium]
MADPLPLFPIKREPVTETEPPASTTASTTASATASTTALASEVRQRYFNRELSWLRFNERVLEEALDQSLPLLERVRYLSIFASNLDEFFMIRVSGLRRQLNSGVLEAPLDGMTPGEQLAAIRTDLLPLLKRCQDCWRTELSLKLRESGIKVLSYGELKGKQRKLLRRYFEREVFPVLTPLAFDPGHPFPHISNLSINLAVVVKDPVHGERFARLKVPQSFPRLLRIPDEDRAESFERLGLVEVTAANFVWLEELVGHNVDLLFPGVEVLAVYPFRITRDADVDIEEDEASDLLSAMSEYVSERRFGTTVRLEIDERMPRGIEDILVQNLRLQPFQVYRAPSPIGVADVLELTKVEQPQLKFAPFIPMVPPALATEESIFSVLRRRSVVLFHPYDSFTPVVNFVREAARDPDVLAIKQTLYRVGRNSPIVEALLKARENDKQVAVLVELKARFDEQNNITWARALERAGAHVVYGVVGLKTHAKACLVVRRERDGIRRYVHLATGNYNPTTARIYTDIGLFTCDREIADDVSDLFNALTGISRKRDYRKLLVAPVGMREEIVRRIEREIEDHKSSGAGRIVLKLNALTDRVVIDALYAASQAGVQIELQVRGISCLRPGVPGLSEQIKVTSIVGRLLEHTRMYWFRNGGDEELFVGSADMMGRNLERRVETLFPIEDPRLRAALRDDVLFFHLADTAKARRLTADGTWLPVLPEEGSSALNTQAMLLEKGGRWRNEE